MKPDWLNADVKAFDEQMIDAALARQAQLTKPPGALGDLEALAVFLAGAQAREQPRVEKTWISIFAGDHGVVAEGVSAQNVRDGLCQIAFQNHQPFPSVQESSSLRHC